MLIIVDSSRPEDNRNWLNTFENTIILSPHSRIALTKAKIPVFNEYDIPQLEITNLNQTLTFNITQLIVPSPPPPAPNFTSQQVSITLPLGTYRFGDLMKEINIQLASKDLGIGTTIISASLLWDKSCSRFYFSFGASFPNVTPQLPHTISLIETSLGVDLGFNFATGGGAQGEAAISFQLEGNLYAPYPPRFVRNAYENVVTTSKPINITIPNLQLQTPLSSSTIRNLKSVAHTILYTPKFNLEEYCNTFGAYPSGATKTGYFELISYDAPTLQYVEINNDTITPLNDLQITMLDNNGELNTFVSIQTTSIAGTRGTDETITLVFELETEPEKNQGALRAVKDKIRFDKFLKNHQFTQPI